METEKKQPFDPDLSPAAPANTGAAKDHNLRWDPKKEAYVDAEGSLVRDRFGQRY